MKIRATIIFATIMFLAGKNIYAISWPMFSAPDLNVLLTQNDMDTDSCPKGQGKLLDHVSIYIPTTLCKNFCPKSWHWVTHSDNQCHDLSTFNSQANEIKHTDARDGTTSYSQISLYFGDKNALRSENKVVFTTQPNDHWFCIEIDSMPNSFTCASDI